MPRATFLLPPAQHLAEQPLSAVTSVALGRADRLPSGEAGRRAQLLRHVDLLPRGAWPTAALMRQLDVGDAAHAAWLFAEPVWLRADMNGVRLMAHGERMDITQDDADALLPALRPVFGDAGFLLDAPSPARWYVQLPRAAKIPKFSEPAQALGEDLFEHTDTSPESRRWRALDSEVQVLLHNHPHNAVRAEQGKPPVNALWFWGGGTLPDATVDLRSPYAQLLSDDPLARALGGLLKLGAPLPAHYATHADDRLFDLAHGQQPGRLENDWLHPALDALRAGKLDLLELDFEHGGIVQLHPRQRWRVWRKPLKTLG